MKNKEEHIDHLLKKKLIDFEASPSPLLWDGIAQRYDKQSLHPSRKNRIAYSLGVFILMGLFVILNTDQSYHPRIETGEETLKTVETSKSRSMDSPEATIVQAEKMKSPGLHTQAPSQINTKRSATNTPASSSSLQTHAGSISMEAGNEASNKALYSKDIEPIVQESPDPSVSMISTTKGGELKDVLSAVHTLPRLQSSTLGQILRPTSLVLKHESTLTSISGKPPTTGFRPIWSAGLFYIPELYHSASTNAERTLLGFEALLRWTRYQYTLETGLGFSQVSNDNLFTVDYNAYLGTYKALDSISFSLDPLNQTVIPHYYFNEVTVYDTATQTAYTRMKNQYTYVQIPVFIGYRSAAYDRLTFTLKGGPMLSLLVGSKEPDAYLDARSRKIVRIEDRTPGRVRTNWQMLVNAGMSLQMTHHISLSLEPGIRWHLNPIYEQASGRPWSVNLRMGLVYEF